MKTELIGASTEEDKLRAMEDRINLRIQRLEDDIEAYLKRGGARDRLNGHGIAVMFYSDRGAE